MIASVRKAKSEFCQLVKLASGGEEVIITLRGKPVVRLSKIPEPATITDRSHWIRQLKHLRNQSSTGARAPTVDEILADDRQ